MNVEGLLARLQRVRRSGSGWQASCPGHDDKNPSLSITVRDEKILVYCHAGCSQETVLGALKIEARELFLKAGDSKARVVAEYPYTDDNGRLLFQVVRLEPKNFRQRRPDGKGGWLWRLNGTPRVLYRLPELRNQQSIIICEGEKDCDMARRLGLVATCNPGGAGKWKDQFSEALCGKTVTIIADADPPGRKHADQVAASLAGKAQSVKVLELPKAKDLTEWLERGGSTGEARKAPSGTLSSRR
jgi:putative DNA primase/helicase